MVSSAASAASRRHVTSPRDAAEQTTQRSGSRRAAARHSGASSVTSGDGADSTVIELQPDGAYYNPMRVREPSPPPPYTSRRQQQAAAASTAAAGGKVQTVTVTDADGAHPATTVVTLPQYDALPKPGDRTSGQCLLSDVLQPLCKIDRRNINSHKSCRRFAS